MVLIPNQAMQDIDAIRMMNPVLGQLFKKLYGQKTFSEVSEEAHDLWSLKKHYLKIMKSMRYAVEETIYSTDKTHSRKIEQVLCDYESLLKKCRMHHEVDQVMIAFQTELFFKLLGDFTERSSENDVVNSQDKWRLNHYRQIQFVQTKEQKRNIIFSVIQEKYRDRFDDWENFIIDIYLQKCNKDPDRFIDWLAENHPDIYTSIF